MERSISFNTQGHDSFIDFLKAYAILCVLFGHTFPHIDKIGYALWAGMQVPIFILIQAFHVLKKDSFQFNMVNLLRRIFIPFAATTIITIIISMMSPVNIIGGNTLNIRSIILAGGVGPGSYYPWIFIQIAVILPYIRPMLNKGTKHQQTIIAIIICEIFEIVVSKLGIPDYIYRLVALRYMFLIYLAWLWIKDGIVLNKKTFILSILSLLSIIYFEYYSFDNRPFFCNTSWKFHRWPCYYFVSTLLCYLLYCIYKSVSQIDVLNKAINILAKCSYEIFLVQMALITLIPYFGIGWIMLIVFSSILGGYYFNKIYSLLLSVGRPYSH